MARVRYVFLEENINKKSLQTVLLSMPFKIIYLVSHQDQKVSVISENNEKTSGTVKCIDEFGYIMVELPNGEMVSLQPGNNSFDMMQGLIMPKKSK